jgi:hypothetical protein
MTVSLWRRLTDLGSDADIRRLKSWISVPDGSTSTEDVLEAAALDERPILAEALGSALVEVGRASSRRTFVAVLSETQALSLRTATEEQPDRVLTWLLQAAPTAVVYRLVMLNSRRLLREDGNDAEPWSVVRLVDGAPPARTVRDSHRLRSPRRYTLSEEAINWVDAEASRTGHPASRIVDEAILAAARSAAGKT